MPMLGHRRGRWPSIGPTSGQRLAFAGDCGAVPIQNCSDGSYNAGPASQTVLPAIYQHIVFAGNAFSSQRVNRPL